MSVLQSFLQHASRVAVADKAGHYTYAQVLSASIALQRSIQEHIGKSNTDAQPRIAYACPRDASYVLSKTATWLSNGIGVPLAESYPAEEIRYALTDSGTSCVLTCAARASVVGPVCASLGIPVIQVGPLAQEQPVLPRADLQEAVEATLAVKDPNTAGAFMIYTSGTTGRPKGVLTTHAMLHAQTHAMGSAWGWSQEDRIYSVLPLHHVHGIVAVVLTALAYGASVEFATKFDSLETWKVLTRPAPPPTSSPAAREQALLDTPTAFAPTLFMAVPTVYAKMLELAGKEAELSKAWSAALQDRGTSPVRLMVSGSAALPESIARQWRERTGHTLLERYGMTEFAMAISNPLHGEKRLNSVGQPLPGYEARLVPETVAEGDSPKASTGGGELQIRGPGVFKGYWNKPEATAESFTPDGWFKTGDRAVLSADGGYYSIQGRMSVDILKTNGYKVSALDIERELLEHSGVAEIAVLGLPDEAVGEKIAAVVVVKAGSPLAAMAAKGAEGEAEALTELRAFASKVLAPYKIPTILRILPEIPRNAMGKVNKKSLRKEVFGV